jgi:hypothetical protein
MPDVALALAMSMPQVAMALIEGIIEGVPKIIQEFINGITGGITGTYVIVDGKRVPGITGADVHITDDWEALVKYTQINS